MGVSEIVSALGSRLWGTDTLGGWGCDLRRAEMCWHDPLSVLGPAPQGQRGQGLHRERGQASNHHGSTNQVTWLILPGHTQSCHTWRVLFPELILHSKPNSVLIDCYLEV